MRNLLRRCIGVVLRVQIAGEGRLEDEKMEEVSEFKYLETVLCKHGGMEGEIRELSDER